MFNHWFKDDFLERTWRLKLKPAKLMFEERLTNEESTTEIEDGGSPIRITFLSLTESEYAMAKAYRVDA